MSLSHTLYVKGSANKRNRAPALGVSTIIAIQYTVSFNFQLVAVRNIKTEVAKLTVTILSIVELAILASRYSKSSDYIQYTIRIKMSDITPLLL